MKPNVVVDEMFPEGAGSYMDLEEVYRYCLKFNSLPKIIHEFVAQ